MTPLVIAFVITSALIFAMPSHATAQIYTWTDKDGVKHYSNTAPDPEAVEAEEEAESISKPKDRKTILKESIEKSKEQTQQRTDIIIENLKKKTSTTTAPSAPYRITTYSVYPDGANHIKITGRIEGGEACSRLRVSMYLHSNKGGSAHAIFVVDEAGGSASKLFETRDYVSDHTKDTWKLGNVYFECSSR